MNISLLIADVEAKPRYLIVGAELEMFRDVPGGGENRLLAVAVEVRARTEVDVGPQLESGGHRVDQLQIREVIRGGMFTESPILKGVITLSRNHFGSTHPPPPAFASHCIQKAY